MPISDPAVSRLPLYRALAAEALGRGEAFISCTAIAEQLNLLAGFDIDRRKVGRAIGGKPVYPLERLPPFARQEGVLIAVLTVPAEAAQCVADLAVQAGIRGLWNFTAVPVVPSEVIVQRVELAASLALLSKRMTEALHLRGAAPGTPKALNELLRFDD